MLIFLKVNNLTNLTNLIDLTSDFREKSIVVEPIIFKIFFFRQIHLRKYWDTRYSAMEPNSEVTRMLKEAQEGPSSSSNGAIAASAGEIHQWNTDITGLEYRLFQSRIAS